ncbi:STAS domain-containing protein [Nonomuraea solani]|uniref:STAS domain-containing protein n=1 Tax=Nonomuraea solani TaxID=1144553 RepID=UPI001F2282C0|nr:STAS domain-containing protein [Nonomuraea solani]
MSAAGAPPVADSQVRLWLDPVLDRRGARDGVWWPYSRDAAAELPGLIAAVDQRLSQVVVRIGLEAGFWDDIPYRVPARGREVAVECVHEADPHLIVLAFAHAEPVTLQLVPPGTGSGQVARMRDAYARAGSAIGPPEVDAFAGWENEGGHLIDRDVQAVSGPRRTGRVGQRSPAFLLRSESRTTLTDAFPLGRADRSKPTTVGLSGEIDIFTGPTLRSRLEGVLTSSTPLLVLDLSAVSFCDASGLAVIVDIQRRARLMGITLALAAPRPFMGKLLRITGLDRSLPMM